MPRRITTIALAAAKGGGGKTTLTAALAAAAMMDSPTRRIALMDLDPQGSLTFWWNSRTAPTPVLYVRGAGALASAIRIVQRDGVDLLFLDCPPGFSAVLEEAIAVADLALVPTQASALDLAAVAATAEMAERLGARYRFILNRAIFRSRIAGEAVRALRDRSGLLLPPVHQRVAIAEAMTAGKTVVETDPASPAGQELLALWRAVDAVIGDLPARRPHRSSL